MSFLNPPPAPKTKLGRYRQLAPRAAIHVSPISLGGMSIGNSEKWNSSGFGAMNRDSSFKLMDAYYDAGGNFIDTANIYQNGTSEELIGEWMEQRKIRDQMIIATKYSNFTHNGDDSIAQRVNYIGNNVKSMKLSVEASLQRLRTGYIDILYVHWYDQHTSVEEMMDALHNLVVAGKVLYLGISDTPAWVVVKANDYAKSVGKTPFVVYQGEYSVLQRDIEREIIPMCTQEGLGLHVWGVLAGGKIRTNEEEKSRMESGEKGRIVPRDPEWLRKPDQVKVCDGLEAMAKEVGAKSIGALAIAYVLHKTQYMFPILGGRKVEQLMANLEALDISLSAEQIEQLDGLKEFNLGWPYNLLGKPGTYPFLITIHATIDPIPAPSPIRPVKEQ
ncbi:hypothetical protein D9758_014476 [Tetrapyrgos nigripes]|uniref:NADP-dependent oxidoreductase domain-containing protein n=1 Tax=Tetrapyrgos nigripes TaxID=182062 RepID=A0A8H5C735_9AGAR|nr:hypothetical protein D9758_014476 [Tetrapyrgos nigripes]